MITCQCAEAMRTYATQSSYLTPIPNVNIDRGVIPLDSLPADWWNWLWQNITLNEGYIVQFINSVFSEINSVLSAAGVSPSTASTTDLRDAIQALAQVVATSSVPGSVLSSTLSGKLNVIADGTATINGLGTPSDLQTTADSVVAAINEVLTLASGKAPTSHASSNNTYGVGTTQQFGHVKVTEGCGLSICDGTISLNAPGYNCLGNVTTICFNGNEYTPTDGVIDLGTQTISVDCVCQRAISSSTTGDFYPILGGGLCRNTSGVGEVNLVGLSWNPVCKSLAWDNADNNIIVGTNSAYSGITSSSTGIAIGYCTCINCCSDTSIAIGYCTCINCCSDTSIAIGHLACVGNRSHTGIAIGYCAYIGPSDPWAVAIGTCARAVGPRGIALGYCTCGISSDTIAVGTLSRTYCNGNIAIGIRSRTCYCDGVYWEMMMASGGHGIAHLTIVSGNEEEATARGLCQFYRYVLFSQTGCDTINSINSMLLCQFHSNFHFIGNGWNGGTTDYKCYSGGSSTFQVREEIYATNRTNAACTVACLGYVRMNTWYWRPTCSAKWACGLQGLVIW